MPIACTFPQAERVQHLDRLNYTLCESGSQVYIHKESGSQTVSGRVSCSRSVAHQTFQAEDFKLLGHPTVQRGEFYKLKFVGWCVGWLRRVRRVTLLALHQLTCRRLDNEHSLTMLGCAELLWLGVGALVPCLSHCLDSFALVPLPWLLWLGSFGLASFALSCSGRDPLAWFLWLGSSGLVPLACSLWLGSSGLAPLAWLLWLGPFGLASFGFVLL